MRNRRLTAIIAMGLIGGMVSVPVLTNHQRVENVRLLADTTVNTTVNNNGNNNSTTVNNTVNNIQQKPVTKDNNQTQTPASSKKGYKAGEIIVSLGANLSLPQREQMLKDFGVKEGQSGLKIVSTTNYDIAYELGMPTNNISPTSQSISSTKVTLLPAGSGISVSTNNLTQVTGDMLASALVTCGISDASIVANSPYPVTGQAALAGILQGFQDATGNQIPEANKKAANDEVNVTTSLGKQIGQQKAEHIVTGSKKEVIDQKPENTTQITNIINNNAKSQGVTLTPQQEQELTTLMQQIKNLNLNAKQANSTLKQIQDSIANGKKDFSNVSQAISNEYNKLKSEGVFSKIGDWFHRAWTDICVFFDGGKTAVENQNTQQPQQPQQTQSAQQPQQDQKVTSQQSGEHVVTVGATHYTEPNTNSQGQANVNN